MHYDMFLFKTTCNCGDAMGLCRVPLVMKKETHQDRQAWKESRLSDVMLPFSATLVKQQIETELPGLCRVVVCYPPPSFSQIPFLSVVTSYRKIKEVLMRVCAIAAENGLVFYDAEREKIVYRDLLDDILIDWRNREKDLLGRIRAEYGSIWKINKIDSCDYDVTKSSAHVITLRWLEGVSLEERTRRFYELLQAALLENETLLCENRCFTVQKEYEYEITFCLEAYKNHPFQTGFYENGQPCSALLHRMSCLEAIRWMQQRNETMQKDIRRGMRFFEMTERFQNPADRFVHCVNIAKRLSKEWFDVRYSGFGFYGSEILFYPDFDEDDGFEPGQISVLKVEEETFTFLIPFMKDVYPYIEQRYYDKNPIPIEMWVQFIERLKKAKEMILHNTFDPKLKPYINSFNLFCLPDDSRDVPADENEEWQVYNAVYWERGNGYRIKHEPTQYLYEHRYDVARLFDVVISWSDTVLESYGGCLDIMCVQGP